MKKPQFTPQQAQALINMVLSASLRNMDHAKNTAALLQQFATWYNALTAPKAKPTKVEPSSQNATSAPVDRGA